MTYRMLLMLLALVPAAAVNAHDRWSGQRDPEVVIEWNQLLTDTVPASVGLQSVRYYSMLHVAMFDAVNSIEADYGRFHTRIEAARGASADAAAAQAARDVLTALIPSQQATFDAALEARLARIPAGSAAQGRAVGQEVARRIIAWRTNDGWSSTPPPFVLPNLPGLWQPTPPANAPAAFTQFPSVRPFALLTATQFLPRRFPELPSERYASDFNEVKELGSATSATRNADETLLARAWAGIGYQSNPFTIWFRIGRDTARASRLSLVETARLFAGLSVAINDGLQTSYSSKLVYGFWRPVTAVRRADEDLNAATTADPGWLPLLPTPPYPSHSGNVACVSAAAARVLQRVYGRDDVAFSVTWTGIAPTPEYRRNYTGFWQAALDGARSRIVGGIHFTFESEASQEACPLVANWIFDFYMRPKSY